MSVYLVIIGILVVIIFLLTPGLIYYRDRIAKLESTLDKCTGQLETLQNSFHRFAPRYVVEEIISKGISVQAERKEVTVLFADIVDFTKLSELLNPEDLVKVMNGYFKIMSGVITSNNGHVSKFIGDEIMALFGVPDSNPWQANDAVKTGLAMQKKLDEYNRQLKMQELPELNIGCGIHSGQAIAGVIGSHELLEYTVLGDTVNTANRIQNLTRELEGTLLISEEVAKQISAKFQVEKLPAVQVKGKKKKLTVFRVYGYGD